MQSAPVADVDVGLHCGLPGKTLSTGFFVTPRWTSCPWMLTWPTVR